VTKPSSRDCLNGVKTAPATTAATGSGNGGGGGGGSGQGCQGGAGGGLGEADEAGNETWILLGAPWLEGHIALRPVDQHGSLDGTFSGAATPPPHPPPWRRVWCVLQDSAFAFFEHERAAADDQATPIDAIEWLHIRSITLDNQASHMTHCPPAIHRHHHASVPPTAGSANSCSNAGPSSTATSACTFTPSAVASATSAASVAVAGSPGSTFQVRLVDGRCLSIRVDTPTQRALWVKEMLRLASWRAIHVLQLELASEWQHVRVVPHNHRPERHPAWEPPTCSSPPSQPLPA